MDPDKELLDAVNAAIDTATPGKGGNDDGAAETPTGDEGAADAHAQGEAAAGDDSRGAADAGAKDADGDGGDGKKPDDADPNADRGDGRNAAGRFVKKQGETDEQLEARRRADPNDGKPATGAKPDAGTGKKPPAKTVDHVNDPIPADVQGRTRERMQGLVKIAKDVTADRDTIKTERDELIGLINTASGGDADLFWRHTELLGYMMSDDPAKQRAAVTSLRKAADQIASELGDAVPGKDPLEGHQDLIDDVEAGDLSRERAIELANARNRDKAANKRNTETEAERAAREEYDTAKGAAIKELNAFGDQLKTSDPAYAVKRAALKDAMQTLAQTVHPSKWASTYKAMYKSLKLAATPAAAPNGDGQHRVPAGTGDRQPRRGTQGAGGGGKREPQNELEALNFGIDQASGR